MTRTESIISFRPPSLSLALLSYVCPHSLPGNVTHRPNIVDRRHLRGILNVIPRDCDAGQSSQGVCCMRMKEKPKWFVVSLQAIRFLFIPYFRVFVWSPYDMLLLMAYTLRVPSLFAHNFHMRHTRNAYARLNMLYSFTWACCSPMLIAWKMAFDDNGIYNNGDAFRIDINMYMVRWYDIALTIAAITNRYYRQNVAGWASSEHS